MTVRYKLQSYQLDVKIGFLKSPLDHEVPVRFPGGHGHPSGHACALLHNSQYDLKHSASDRYALQHVRLLAFDPDLLQSVAGPCFGHKVEDDGHFFLLVHVDDYACAFSDRSYFDA